VNEDRLEASGRDLGGIPVIESWRRQRPAFGKKGKNIRGCEQLRGVDGRALSFFGRLLRL